MDHGQLGQDDRDASRQIYQGPSPATARGIPLPAWARQHRGQVGDRVVVDLKAEGVYWKWDFFLFCNLAMLAVAAFRSTLFSLANT